MVHYSCESFYGRQVPTSPRITSIAVRGFGSGQTRSFSIHQMAEREKTIDDIENHYDSLESKMLKAFYEYIHSLREFKFVHWNMRDINYGFEAIEHRAQVQGVKNIRTIEDRDKVDLARVIYDIYGPHYAEHPRLESLLRMNEITLMGFLPGKDEAAAFERRDYVALHQSTLRKVDVLSTVVDRAVSGRLVTAATWWQVHGGRLRHVAVFVAENKWVTFAASVASIVGIVVTLIAL